MTKDETPHVCVDSEAERRNTHEGAEPVEILKSRLKLALRLRLAQTNVTAFQKKPESINFVIDKQQRLAKKVEIPLYPQSSFVPSQ